LQIQSGVCKHEREKDSKQMFINVFSHKENAFIAVEALGKHRYSLILSLCQQLFPWHNMNKSDDLHTQRADN